MTAATNPLNNIDKTLRAGKSLGIRLVFITRNLKSGVPKTAKMLQKYTFQMTGIDTDPHLQKLFLEIATEQIHSAIQEKQLEVTEYEAIDDDTPKLYSYDITNKAIPFREVVHSQINSIGTVVSNLSGFLQGEDVWAYCVDVRDGTRPVCLTFTKLYKSKIAVDEFQNPEKFALKRYFRTKFNVKTAKLELLEGETINFDRRIDCIYSFETGQMYVFNKSNFEKIASLEEEFQHIAQEVVTKLKKAAIIEGFENVAEELDVDAALHRRLYKLAKAIEGQKLDKRRVNKMASIIAEFKLDLRIVKDKVQVKTKRDLDEVIKLLEDYYLKSDQTGNKYGASVKRKL